MAKENIQSLQINLGSHRKKYQKQIFDMIDDLKNTPNEVKAKKIDCCFVLKLYTLLRNFGIYSDDNVYDVVKFFKNNDSFFYDMLENYLIDTENKRKIYKALFVIKNQILNIRDFSSNGFYKDFLDDLKSELELMPPPVYNNFIEPSIYKIDDSDNNISLKKLCNSFKPNYNEGVKENQEANKNTQQIYKDIQNTVTAVSNS